MASGQLVRHVDLSKARDFCSEKGMPQDSSIFAVIGADSTGASGIFAPMLSENFSINVYQK
jgi:hypothetical protein